MSSGGGRRPPKPPPNQQHAHNRTASASCCDDDDNTRYYHDIVPANQLRRAGGTGISGGVGNTMGSEQKIGLIETNLDTHETIITGKTQSLMELGGPPHAHLKHKPVVAGQFVRANGIIRDTCDGTIEVPTSRPHKSMEFLLDKENHRTILVSLQNLISYFCVLYCAEQTVIFQDKVWVHMDDLWFAWWELEPRDKVIFILSIFYYKSSSLTQLFIHKWIASVLIGTT